MPFDGAPESQTNRTNSDGGGKPPGRRGLTSGFQEEPWEGRLSYVLSKPDGTFRQRYIKGVLALSFTALISAGATSKILPLRPRAPEAPTPPMAKIYRAYPVVYSTLSHF